MLRLKAERLMEARIKAGLSQRELGKRSNLAGAFISQLESGKRTASPATAKALCETLGAEFDDLFEIVPNTGPGPAAIGKEVPANV